VQRLPHARLHEPPVGGRGDLRGAGAVAGLARGGDGAVEGFAVGEHHRHRVQRQGELDRGVEVVQPFQPGDALPAQVLAAEPGEPAADPAEHGEVFGCPGVADDMVDGQQEPVDGLEARARHPRRDQVVPQGVDLLLDLG